MARMKCFFIDELNSAKSLLLWLFLLSNLFDICSFEELAMNGSADSKRNRALFINSSASFESSFGELNSCVHITYIKFNERLTMT